MFKKGPSCQLFYNFVCCRSSTYHLLNTEDKTETEAKTEPAGCDSVTTQECKEYSEVPLQKPQAAAIEAVTDASDDAKCQPCGNLENKAIDVNKSEKSTLLSGSDGVHETFANTENKEYVQETIEMLQDISKPDHKSTICDHADTTENICSNIAVAQEKPKLSKLEKLRALGINLSIKPRLCPDDGSFINLDEPKPNKGTFIAV